MNLSVEEICIILHSLRYFCAKNEPHVKETALIEKLIVEAERVKRLPIEPDLHDLPH